MGIPSGAAWMVVGMLLVAALGAATAPNEAALPDTPEVARFHALLAAPRGDAVALAKVAAGVAEVPGVPDVPLEDSLRRLLARHGATADLAPVEGLPVPLRDALGRFVAAYLAFDDASRAAAPTPEQAARLLAMATEAGLLDGPAPPRDLALRDGEAVWLAALPARMGPVVAARHALLQEAAALPAALARVPAGERAVVLAAPPAFALDLAGVDSVWTDDVALLLDAGGHDTYLNNGGGSNLLGDCSAFVPPTLGGAAALVDLGGDDAYLGAGLCGVNGGGVLGAGFLYDAAGDDRYDGGWVGAMGGGSLAGAGFLLDASGADQYLWCGAGAAGGADIGGIGLLVDAGPEADTYLTTWLANSGGARLGWGALVDAGGDDTYLTLFDSVHGGAGLGGQGFLADLDGDDVYAGWYWMPPTGAANGGAWGGGRGFLGDAAGNDRYEAGSGGVNGGASAGGHGMLLDLAGDDTYIARERGANGGGALGRGLISLPWLRLDLPGTGLLLDAGGSDTFTDATGTCANPAPCTVVPKELAGAQLDL